MSYWLLAISILIGVGGQISLKTGTLSQPELAKLYLEPSVLMGLFAYFISALLYIAALRTIPVSVAFPTVSLSYVLVAIIAHFLWGESFGWQQLIGLALIGSGIATLYAHF